MSLAETIRAKAKLYHKDIIAWRRTIHANPELAFEEYKTAEFIQSKLTEWGIPFKAGVAKTGIVGFNMRLEEMAEVASAHRVTGLVFAARGDQTRN